MLDTRNLGNQIRSDLWEIGAGLELASTGKSDLRFQRGINTTSAGYRTLAWRSYETNVHIKHPVQWDAYPSNPQVLTVDSHIMSDTQAILAQLRKQMDALHSIPSTNDPAPKYHAGDTAVLEGEIAKLGATAQDVEIAFTSVSRVLVKIVTMAKDGKLGEDPKEFKKPGEHKTSWDRLHDKYAELVWESRRVAGNARAIALDFAGYFLDVIKDERYSIEAKKQAIAAYRQKLEKDMKNAANLSDGFKDLHNDVVDFREDIKDDVKAWGQATQKLNNLLVDIERVEKEVEKAKNNAITAGVVAGIGFFCPPLWFGSAVLGVKCIKHASQIPDKRNELSRKLAEYQEVIEVANEITEITVSLQPHMEFIQREFETFAKIWTSIRSDLVLVEKGLELTSTARGKILFQKRIKTISTAYKTLAHALRLYETNVHIEYSE